MQLLLTLTRSLPDHTSVQQIILRTDEIQLQGESAAAASLIGLIEASDYFEQVEFRAPLTKNAHDGRERFHLAARLRQP
ncbi:MAG: PilN domain-containing protein [Gammaproteobacteria bacterium]|nr:PilN domain-containing protein [Gammaproteobacteria bacterium]